MINIDPAERPTFDTLLHTSRGGVLPESFYSFLHNYVSSLNEPSTESVAANNPSQAATPLHPSIPSSSSATTIRPSHSGGTVNTVVSTGSEVKTESLPSDSDHRLERIWADYESIEPYIAPEAAASPDMDVKVEFMPALNTTSKPFQVSSANFSVKQPLMCSQ